MKPSRSERALHISIGLLLLVLGIVWAVVGSVFFVLGVILSGLVFSPYKIGHATGHKLLIEALEAMKRSSKKQGS